MQADRATPAAVVWSAWMSVGGKLLRQGSVGTVALLLLAGCGGGGGGGPAPITPPPAPTPTPTPVPAPTPTPGPGGSFQTAEYDRSTGLALANVVPAYQAGATGRGIVAGVIDSGVAADNAEFAGRISAASADLAGARGLQDQGGHGTAVSSVLLGAKNDIGTHGVAFDATLLVLRTDTPGTCSKIDPATGDSACSHNDNAIARGVDLAVAQNARVINISLGGASANATLRAAIGRAASAGMVVVISAGNDATANPDPLALIAADPIAQGLVIIAGAVDAGGTLADFSDRAGSAAQYYLTALGVRVRAIDQTGASFFYNGTSFAAPHIAGAVALLAQAFPNLTGAQIVQLLYRSATDTGEAGVDPVYGHGLLNVGRAFQPQGQTSLAGSMAPVSLSDNGTLSPAMGDAAQGQLGAVILDGYSRAYAVDLARSIRAASPSFTLTAALTGRQRSLAASSAAGTVVALSVLPAHGGPSVSPLLLTSADAERARATAGWVSSRLGKDLSVALGIAQSGDALAGSLAGRSDPAFLVAREIGQGAGFERSSDGAVAIRRRLGPIGLWASAEQGDALVWERRAIDPARSRYQRYPYASLTVGADRAAGAFLFSGAATYLSEDRTVLGAHLGPTFGAGSAQSWFADVQARAAIGGGWSIGAATRQGWTRVGAGGAAGRATMIRTDAYSIDLSATALFARDDRLGFRIAQPLRVRSGGFDLSLPDGYDYSDGVTSYAPARLNLAPHGREVTAEASYGMELWGGRIGGNLFWRRDPGNFAYFPDDKGGALTFSAAFR